MFTTRDLPRSVIEEVLRAFQAAGGWVNLVGSFTPSVGCVARKLCACYGQVETRRHIRLGDLGGIGSYSLGRF